MNYECQRVPKMRAFIIEKKQHGIGTEIEKVKTEGNFKAMWLAQLVLAIY
jgi:hypothetical protein